MAGDDRFDTDWVDGSAEDPEGEEESEEVEAKPEPKPEESSQGSDPEPKPESEDDGTVRIKPQGGGRYVLDRDGRYIRVQ